MATSDQGNEQELAELLREVRSLRHAIDELKASAELRPRFPPTYAVAALTGRLRPDYDVLVRAQLPFVTVVNPPYFQVPTYEVAVRPTLPPEEDPLGE